MGVQESLALFPLNFFICDLLNWCARSLYVALYFWREEPRFTSFFFLLGTLLSWEGNDGKPLQITCKLYSWFFILIFLACFVVIYSMFGLYLPELYPKKNNTLSCLLLWFNFLLFIYSSFYCIYNCVFFFFFFFCHICKKNKIVD